MGTKVEGVALLVSAWIEIEIQKDSEGIDRVALLVSAWIEIYHYKLI